jgi:tRNA nucleotidyltransferase (CCA-adding enzyme)
MQNLAYYFADILAKEGYQAFVVGGGVRDELLGRVAHDIDIATNASPEEVVSIFEHVGQKAIPTGIKHGTVTIVIQKPYTFEVPFWVEQKGFLNVPNGTTVEITTFRKDGDYSDGRHPDSVEFGNNIEEDLARRDFTINAIAKNPLTGEYVDPFGGQADLEAGIVRAVGNAKARFLEDGLRPLRAVRFSAQLNFLIATETGNAIVDSDVVENIKRVSLERVRDEILKGLGTDKAFEFAMLLYEYRLLDLYLPELLAGENMPQPKKFHRLDVLNHSLAVLAKYAEYIKNPELRLIALLHDIGKPVSWNKSETEPHFYGHEDTGAELIEQVLRRLKFDNDTITTGRSLVQNHMDFYKPEWSDGKVKKWINKVGKERVEAQIFLHKADTYGTYVRDRWVELPLYDQLLSRAKTIIAKEEAMSVRDLELNGYDIMAMGFKGQQIAKIKNALLEKVLEDPTLNTKEQLAKLVPTISL